MNGATTGDTHGRGRPMAIDRFLPTFDVTQIRNAVVDATPEETYDAVRHVDLVRIGAVPWLLGELRYLPARILALWRGTEPPETPDSLTFDDLTDESPYVVLDERPGEEFVLGAVGTFWQPEIEWAEVDAAEFATFDRPGYAKLVIGVSVRPYGTDRTLVTYEARTATTDGASRRRFRRYWTLVGPFAGYLMGRVLETARTEVERGRRIPVE